ncbi:undecaprenyl-diphosphate phosphatase [Robertkochia solimangrovi]|uniref:undecaprenyl-diphosphate phosphatase n=1 Tax=Robertkochia solimangrovi TaxID=2213046 RepID=UPI00117FE604|nr:undecaprenyl-diphosphate phosphatase [Robertkochia solimangrovi]TRZ44476.1 UDP-diphosphatase [Robertkochia solimangrovi]
MEILDAIILGIIQGLTEFLPVSSSGHLELGKVLLGEHSIPQESMLFTVILHFATALSTIVVFRRDITTLLQGVFSSGWNEDKKFALKIILSMIPAALIGYFFEAQLESLFGGNILLVGFMLIVTALLLYLADKAKSTGKEVSNTNAFVIGVSQAIAMLPGISRSGATISTSVLLGNDKAKAARFSFLMVVPLIFGKIVKDTLSGEISLESNHLNSLLIGFIAAFISGMIACTWMIKLVRNSKLVYFSVYCFIVGILSIVLGYYYM